MDEEIRKEMASQINIISSKLNRVRSDLDDIHMNLNNLKHLNQLEEKKK